MSLNRNVTSITQTLSMLKSNQTTCVKVMEQCLNQLESSSTKTNSFISVVPKHSLLMKAKEAEKNYQGQNVRLLEGIPVAIKDNICTRNLPTTCASKILKDFKSPFNATVVELLESQGAIIVGKANMDEFGMGSLGSNSAFGPTYTPVKTHSKEVSPSKRYAGGSSSGSAVSVAEGSSLGALGSDTGGSVRLPASYCGVVGLKPSYGLLSRFGLIAYASSLDTVGILTKTVEDSRLLFDILSQFDHNDQTSVGFSVRKEFEKIEIESKRKDILQGFRIGIPKEFNMPGIHSTALRAWKVAIEKLELLGADIVHVSLPSMQFALASYYTIALGEASSNLAKYDGIRYGIRQNDTHLPAESVRELFGEEVKKRILLGSFILSSGYYENFFKKAQKVRGMMRSDFNAVFKRTNPTMTTAQVPNLGGVDVLLTPASLNSAPLTDSSKEGIISTEEYLSDVMTVPASLAGIPALVFPQGGPSELENPIGIQLIAQYGDEATLFHIGAALQNT